MLRQRDDPLPSTITTPTSAVKPTATSPAAIPTTTRGPITARRRSDTCAFTSPSPVVATVCGAPCSMGRWRAAHVTTDPRGEDRRRERGDHHDCADDREQPSVAVRHREPGVEPL